MMLWITENIAVAVSMIALILWFAEDQAWYYGATQVAAQLFFVGDAQWHHHNPVAAAANMACAALWGYWTWDAWKNRKTRKKRKLLSKAGYKARAVLLKLVKSMPRPKAPRIRVPSPVPG